MPRPRSIPVSDRFTFVGKTLGADFVNTIAPDRPEGGLRTGRDVVEFLIATGAIDAGAAARTRRRIAVASDAQRLLAAALALRNRVTTALEAIAARRALDAQTLAAFNAILEADAGFERIDGRRGASYELTFHKLHDDLESLLAPIVRDVARLLVQPGAPIRRCAGEDCVRYFFDDSRTRRRRWCDMAICGNRAKVSAFAQRRRNA